MKTYRIATIPGDGIGKEVVPAGKQVLEALARTSNGFQFEFEDFDWGADKYLKEKVSLPPGAIELLRDEFDAMVQPETVEQKRASAN